MKTVQHLGLAPLAVTAVVAAAGGFTVEGNFTHFGPPAIRIFVQDDGPVFRGPIQHFDASWTTAHSVWLDYVIHGEVRTSA